MKLLLLINPASGKGRRKHNFRADDFQKLLTEHEIAYEPVILSSIEEARKRAEKAQEVDTVVACGGDGTINAVADGVLRNRNQDLKFGVLYSGTSPDFCQFHRIPLDPLSAVKLLKKGITRPVDILELKHNDVIGHFFCSCNLGMGADVAASANRMRPILGDKLGTLVALLKSIIQSKKYDYTLNGTSLKNCNHLLITRMPYIAGGLRLNLPDLKDGEYAIWYLQNQSFFSWLKLLPRFYLGKKVGTTEVYSGATRISSQENVNIEFDGDPHGTLPLEVRVADRKLNLIAGD